MQEVSPGMARNMCQELLNCNQAAKRMMTTIDRGWIFWEPDSAENVASRARISEPPSAAGQPQELHLANAVALPADVRGDGTEASHGFVEAPRL